jgi:hypothetical protein
MAITAINKANVIGNTLISKYVCQSNLSIMSSPDQYKKRMIIFI